MSMQTKAISRSQMNTKLFAIIHKPTYGGNGSQPGKGKANLWRQWKPAHTRAPPLVGVPTRAVDSSTSDCAPGPHVSSSTLSFCPWPPATQGRAAAHGSHLKSHARAATLSCVLDQHCAAVQAWAQRCAGHARRCTLCTRRQSHETGTRLKKYMLKSRG
eukprot:363142-Chlamydomonas_euryale.AAC.11